MLFPLTALFAIRLPVIALDAIRFDVIAPTTILFVETEVGPNVLPTTAPASITLVLTFCIIHHLMDSDSMLFGS